jgi:hypothetical protein
MARTPLKPLAGIGVADTCDEEAEGERQHDDVQHGKFLCDMNRDAGSPVIAFAGAEVPPRA